jgi:hypothetical protein
LAKETFMRPAQAQFAPHLTTFERGF